MTIWITFRSRLPLRSLNDVFHLGGCLSLSLGATHGGYRMSCPGGTSSRKVVQTSCSTGQFEGYVAWMRVPTDSKPGHSLLGAITITRSYLLHQLSYNCCGAKGDTHQGHPKGQSVHLPGLRIGDCGDERRHTCPPLECAKPYPAA